MLIHVDEDEVIQWYNNFIINSESANNQTGINNGLSQAFGFELPSDKVTDNWLEEDTMAVFLCEFFQYIDSVYLKLWS